jgi:hypothetical protein
VARVRDFNGPLAFYNTSLKTVKILDGGAGKIGLGVGRGSGGPGVAEGFPIGPRALQYFDPIVTNVDFLLLHLLFLCISLH